MSKLTSKDAKSLSKTVAELEEQIKELRVELGSEGCKNKSKNKNCMNNYYDILQDTNIDSPEDVLNILEEFVETIKEELLS